MVFYFTSEVDGYVVYMGKDKFENEDLIEWGLLTDLWFHVDGECVQPKLIYIYILHSFLILLLHMCEISN